MRERKRRSRRARFPAASQAMRAASGRHRRRGRGSAPAQLSRTAQSPSGLPPPAKRRRSVAPWLAARPGGGRSPQAHRAAASPGPDRQHDEPPTRSSSCGSQSAQCCRSKYVSRRLIKASRRVLPEARLRARSEVGFGSSDMSAHTFCLYTDYNDNFPQLIVSRICRSWRV